MPAYSPGGTLNAFAGGLTHKGQIPSVHRLPRGLPGYLILFDTRAFEHERRSRAGRLPSRSEFFVISMHFTATPRVPPSLPATKGSSSRRCTGLSPALSRPPPALPLNPINPDNARTFRITAAAGTELAGPYSRDTCKALHVAHFILPQKQFTTRRAVILHATWLVQPLGH